MSNLESSLEKYKEKICGSSWKKNRITSPKKIKKIIMRLTTKINPNI